MAGRAGFAVERSTLGRWIHRCLPNDKCNVLAAASPLARSTFPLHAGPSALLCEPAREGDRAARKQQTNRHSRLSDPHSAPYIGEFRDFRQCSQSLMFPALMTTVSKFVRNQMLTSSPSRNEHSKRHTPLSAAVTKRAAFRDARTVILTNPGSNWIWAHTRSFPILVRPAAECGMGHPDPARTTRMPRDFTPVPLSRGEGAICQESAEEHRGAGVCSHLRVRVSLIRP
jgi:hypothetical protein